MFRSVTSHYVGCGVSQKHLLEGLGIINCLKATGMPIKEIKVFIAWCIEGDTTLKERYEMFLERKEVVEAQILEMQQTLNLINHKCWYYKTALEAGTEKVHENFTKVSSDRKS